MRTVLGGRKAEHASPRVDELLIFRSSGAYARRVSLKVDV